MEIRLKRMAERQLQSSIQSVENVMRSGAITEEEADLQKEILRIGFKMDIGEITDSEGNKLIEKLLNSQTED